MPRFLTPVTGRFGLAAVLLAASGGAVLAAAPAASAAPMIQQCQPGGGTSYNSSEINVTDYMYCLPLVFKRDVSIWQFSSANTWVEVASGAGTVIYTCKGTTKLVYKTVTVDFGTEQFYDTCG